MAVMIMPTIQEIKAIEKLKVIYLTIIGGGDCFDGSFTHLK